MNAKHDIQTLDDVKLLVDSFYGKVRSNTHIGPIFNERIGDRWPEHLEKMYRFWQTVLLGEHTYVGAPFVPHATMPIEHEHFQTWVGIFQATVSDLFEGKVADEALWRANKMAQLFESKLDYMRKYNTRPLV